MTYSSRAGAPFDLGDSRDLAAAVRAAWHEATPDGPARVEIPRPPLDPRSRPPAGPVDPLAHLRSGATTRFAIQWPSRLRMPTTRPRTRTLVAAGAVFAALIVSAAVPIFSGATGPPRQVAEVREAQSTTTTRQVAPTTAFTYPPETILGPSTTVAPAPPIAAEAASSPASSPASGEQTATTSRPRTSSTTRATPPTTRAPSPTTTQAPAPPPDDGSGSGGSDEPPPYP